MCDSHTKESGTVSTEGLLRDNGDTVSHKSGIIPLRKWVKSVELSKQYNYENESSMTEKETKSGVYTWKQWINVTGILFINYKRRAKQFHWKKLWKSRSSRPQMFFEIGFLKSFANFTRKYLCLGFFLIKLQAFMPDMHGWPL